MDKSLDIYTKANKISKNTGTKDMFWLSQELGIRVYFEDSYKNLLGMYTYAFKQRAIFVNSHLDDQMRQIVIAHEIGHDMLHRDLAKNGALKEFKLFTTMKNNTEYEANAFAAHLLLPTDEFMALAKDGHTISEIASIMNTEINLALIKQKELATIGYNLQKPCQTRGDFMKDIEV